MVGPLITGRDFIFVLLNLDQFKDEEGNSLGSNLIVKVLLPRMTQEGTGTEVVQATAESASSGSKASFGVNFLMNVATVPADGGTSFRPSCPRTWQHCCVCMCVGWRMVPAFTTT